MNWKLGKLIKNKTYKLWGVNISLIGEKQGVKRNCF